MLPYFLGAWILSVMVNSVNAHFPKFGGRSAYQFGVQDPDTSAAYYVHLSSAKSFVEWTFSRERGDRVFCEAFVGPSAADRVLEPLLFLTTSLPPPPGLSGGLTWFQVNATNSTDLSELGGLRSWARVPEAVWFVPRSVEDRVAGFEWVTIAPYTQANLRQTEFEPFGPSAVRPVTGVVDFLALDSSVFTATLAAKPAARTTLRAGFVIGYEEYFVSPEWVTLPSDMMRVHVWERVDGLWFALAPVLTAALMLAVLLCVARCPTMQPDDEPEASVSLVRALSKKKIPVSSSPLEYATGDALLLMIALWWYVYTFLERAIQLGIAMEWSDANREKAWISVTILLGAHAIFWITPSVQLNRHVRGGELKQTGRKPQTLLLCVLHLVLAPVSLFTFGAGYYVGPLCLFAAGVWAMVLWCK